MSPSPPTHPQAAIEITDLRVDYGSFVAVDDVSLSVPAGEIFGLVGPNGAGKTSTFRVLATLMEPTYGEVRLAGIDILENPREARQIIGYMPDLAPVPSDLKVWEFLDLFADSHGLGTATERQNRWEQALAEVGLVDKREANCRALSRGQTQRLVLAKTVLHHPRVMILDEPASGMDPLSRRNLRLAVRRLADEGATIIVSSHILGELAEMCSSLCVMHRGRLLASGSVDEVRRVLGRTERTLTVTVLERAEAAAEWIAGRPDVEAPRVHGLRVTFRFHGTQDEQAAMVAGLIGLGLRVTSFEEQKSTFEDILVEVAEGD